MNSRQFILDGEIAVKVTKRSSSRRIRLTIGSGGQVRVSIPKWVSYAAAIKFAESKKEWIKSKIPHQIPLQPGRRVGKNHQLVFKPTDKSTITTRLSELEATVFYPKDKPISDVSVQTAAKRVIKKALMSQANKLLPIRLKQLADKYGYSYSSVQVKSLKTRWGSCDSHKNITLNTHLMELPWELIDYVILHELNHTVVMQHGPKFWGALNQKLPNYLELRKQLKSFPSSI